MQRYKKILKYASFVQGEYNKNLKNFILLSRSQNSMKNQVLRALF